jgi:hypothetical protein
MGLMKVPEAVQLEKTCVRSATDTLAFSVCVHMGMLQSKKRAASKAETTVYRVGNPSSP